MKIKCGKYKHKLHKVLWDMKKEWFSLEETKRLQEGGDIGLRSLTRIDPSQLAGTFTLPQPQPNSDLLLPWDNAHQLLWVPHDEKQILGATWAPWSHYSYLAPLKLTRIHSWSLMPGHTSLLNLCEIEAQLWTPASWLGCSLSPGCCRPHFQGLPTIYLNSSQTHLSVLQS